VPSLPQERRKNGRYDVYGDTNGQNLRYPRHTKYYEKLRTLNAFRQFWYEKWQYPKDLALKAFLNPNGETKQG